MFTPCQKGKCSDSRVQKVKFGAQPKRVSEDTRRSRRDGDYKITTEYMEKYESSSSSSSSSSEEKCEEFVCGKASLVLKDDCDLKYKIPLMTDPDEALITKTILCYTSQLKTLFTRPAPITVQDILNLRVTCPNSAFTFLSSGGFALNGLYIGDESAQFFADAFNASKVVLMGNQTTLSVTTRLISGDVLLLNVVLKQLSQMNELISSLTISGYYHVLNCGGELSVDTATVFTVPRPVV